MTYHHGNLRQGLLDRAAEVIAEQGVEALSLRALARDLGVSHAAPSRHFKDKTALLSALAIEGHRRLTTALNIAADAAGSDPVARYNAIGKAVIRFSLENPAYYRTTNHPEVLQCADENLIAAYKAYMRALREAATAAQAAGWHPQADVLTLLVFSTAAAIGTAAMFTETRQSGLLTGVDLSALADRVIDLVVPASSAECKAHEGGQGHATS